MCSVSHLFSDLSCSQNLWKAVFKSKWETQETNGGLKRQGVTEERKEGQGDTKKSDKERNEVEGKENENENGNDDSVKNWKEMYKQRVKSITEMELQKVSACALRYQSRIALLQSRKREYDGYLKDLQNKKARVEDKQKTVEPVPVGWHPSFIQDHFNEQKEEKQQRSIPLPKNKITTDHGHLEARYEAVMKKRIISEQVREKFSELSNEAEQRKMELRAELKKFKK